MNRIRLLSEQVANQIAAGEVVERPASVVKELVENALDAQANRISVEIQAGGRSLIRVIDDGVGMSRDDALLCLERHATSKIEKADDLSSISTMGFRGEALPSIASVSRMTLTTRERDPASLEGSQVIIHGGRILEVKAAGCAPGTTLEVRQLFFNLPARRKFMRSEETERAHIQHYLTLAALAFPEVSFTFVQENRVVWELPAIKGAQAPNGRISALEERWRALQPSATRLLPVNFSAVISALETSGEIGDKERDRFHVWGFMGEPGVSRGTRDEQYLFVNRRPVENRGLNFALLEGYHTALMKGRYPVCCLFLEIDPAAVDVNIHPAKREIKFHQERSVRRLVVQAVRETLLGFHTRQATTHTLAPLEKPRSEIAVSSQAASALFPQPLPNPTPTTNPQPVEALALPKPVSERRAAVSPRLEANAPDEARWPLESNARAPASQTPAETAQTNIPEATPLLNVPLRLVGVVGRLYVVLESDRGLVLLDQHAAHERILFEQMLARLEKENAPSQHLLLPETIELSTRDAQFLREQLPTLTRLGVGVSEFGERTFLLDALPPFVKAPDARRFVLELLDQLKASGETVNSWRLGEHTVAKAVCRQAVKANDSLAGADLENLVENLRRCAMPYTCPHGRPTLIEMNFRELEKKFGRIQ